MKLFIALAVVINASSLENLYDQLVAGVITRDQFLREYSKIAPEEDMATKTCRALVEGFNKKMDIDPDYQLTEAEETLYNDCLGSLPSEDSNLRGIDLLTIQDPWQTKLNTISEYGCWCHLYNSMATGHGAAVNRIDGLCKNLHHGYECIKMDAEDENDSGCDPFTMTVYAAWGVNLPQAKQESLCQFLNDTPCGVRTCMVEVRFFSEMAMLAIDPTHTFSLAPTHIEAGGDFDWVSQCTITPGQHEKECCGLYPYRAPFNASNGKSCCNNKTKYDTLRQCCNDDGEVQVYGSC